MEIKDLGLIDYQQAWRLQKQYVDAVIHDRCKEFLLLCEHPPVLTLGRLADRRHILCPDNVLAGRNISVAAVDRGGDVTLHAPGQLTAYPIFSLHNRGKNLHRYLEKLEQVGIDFLRLFDIMGRRISGKTGVWIDDRKIMSIGIGVRRWVSYHGISMNINTDLSLFSMIHPCGMDIPMTSMRREIGSRINMDDAKKQMISVFQKELGLKHV